MYQVGVYMTSQPTDPAPLTPQAQQLLELMREANDWINRSRLAKLSGKIALNKWDLVLLERLGLVSLFVVRRWRRLGVGMRIVWVRIRSFGLSLLSGVM